MKNECTHITKCPHRDDIISSIQSDRQLNNNRLQIESWMEKKLFSSIGKWQIKDTTDICGLKWVKSLELQLVEKNWRKLNLR